MALQNDTYLIKMKQAGIATNVIASKLSMTEEEVNKRWLELVSTAAAFTSNGYENFAEHFNLTMLQYQNLGQSFMAMGAVLGNPVTMTDLLKLCTGRPEDIAKRILENCMVFPRYTPLSPEQLLKMAEEHSPKHN